MLIWHNYRCSHWICFLYHQCPCLKYCEKKITSTIFWNTMIRKLPLPYPRCEGPCLPLDLIPYSLWKVVHETFLSFLKFIKTFFLHIIWVSKRCTGCRGAFFAWRAPILSWPRIMCSQVRMLKFLEPSREMP